MTVILVGSDGSSTAAGSSSGPCESGVSLSVAAAPAIGPVLTDVADHWAAAHPVIDGACPTVVVTQTSAANEESLLVKPNVTVPDIWVPDSSQWVQRLRTETAGVDTPVQSAWYYPAIASSPLVLAAAPDSAHALAAVAAHGWPAALADTASVRMVDPKATTEGLLALLTTQALVAPATNPSRTLVSTLVDMAKTPLSGPAGGFLALSQERASAPAFPASEQEVFTANTGAGAAHNPSVMAVYPSGKTLSLDFPVVQFAPPGGDPAQRDAAVAFVKQLTQGYAQQRLRSAGFRDASGAPLKTADPVAAGVSATATKRLTIPGPDRVVDALRVWTAAGRTNRTLAVIDLSGSMSETTGGAESKIQFAAAAERAALDFFPDTSSLGLWGFANAAQELVPLGPLSAPVGGVTRRHALAVAAASLPSRTGGNTALYQATLAAYENVRSGYDPAALNSVVVLTDGSNTVNSAVTLDALLGRLRSETNPARPLPVITIAVGGDADVATLKQISAASGGTEYTVDQPSDIRAAYLDAVIKTG